MARPINLKISYEQNKNSDLDKKASLICRVRYGKYCDYKFSTGIKIEPRYFDKQKGRVAYPEEYYEQDNTQYDLHLNVKLSSLEQDIQELKNTCDMDGVEFNNLTVKTFVAQQKEETVTKVQLTYFTEFAEQYIEEISREDAPKYIRVRSEERVASKRTIEEYRLILKRFHEYEKKRNTKVKILDIDRRFRDKFIQWLRENDYTNNNTIYGYVKVVRRITKIAEYEGYKVSPDINNRMAFPTLIQKNIHNGAEVKDAYVTLDEQRRLLDLDLSANRGLENGRDLFIIQCNTGLRYSDLRDEVLKQLGNEHINIIQKKTGGTINIPVLPYVREIVEKRKPYVVSKSALNRHIKKACELAGFDESTAGYKLVGSKVKRKELGMYPKYSLLSSHSGRRSFATNALEMPNISAALICLITGHKDESTLYSYLKKTPEDAAKQFKASFESAFAEMKKDNT